MFTKVAEIISQKGRTIQTIDPEVSVVAAVKKMHELNIGALLVTRGEQLVGIFTERDVLFRVVSENLDPNATRVDQVMTRDPFVVKPTISVNDAMRVITEKRFRHLPVMENARIVGVVSSGDLTRSLVEAQKGQIDALIGSVQSMAHGS